MASMMRLVSLLIVVVLAGCTGGPDRDSSPHGPASEATQAPEMNPSIERTSNPEVVHWEGALVRGAWACNPEIGCEYAPSQSVYNAVFEQELPVGNVTSGNLSLAWDPTSRITEELVLGFRIYAPDCDECPRRYNAEVSGPSPVRVDLSNDMYVAEGEVLRLWVYGAMIHGESVTNTYVGTSDDQPFSVEGAVVVQQVA